jgi:nitrogen-specific signal transduction histidine kinase/CheY-like chemotaxis protein
MTERMRAEEERRKLEAEMQNAQKLESLGVLAGGIAHDFNNLLVTVLGNAALALEELPEDSSARTYIERLEAAARRVAELTDQMLAYSGRSTFAVRSLDLSKLAEEMTPLLEASASRTASFKYDYEEGLPPVSGDERQLQQVIMNLVTNASDSLEGKPGVITLRTSSGHMDGHRLADTFLDEGLPEGLYVCLEVSDTGCGMDAETRARVFDPFFTTKFTGRGLGLAAVLGIVRGHWGTIKVSSELGLGTTVQIWLPAVATESKKLEEETQAVLDTEPRPWQASGVVLVADDEEDVKDFAEQILKRHGFRVLTASNGGQAVEVFREHSDEIDLILLDLTMPVMNGQEAFERIQQIRPGVPVILLSGYTQEDVRSRFTAQEPAAFVKKPYTPRSLAAVLRSVIEGDTAQ